ncbi:helicase-related protein, partial [Oligoflexaceae bacterium]|nr:helicase-related protein [Oligoflexaceae bacterium]
IHSSNKYSSVGDEYFKFSDSFPYEETEDQERVIAEVNHDLSAETPMDRLVCGDVGFGKTEVAIRATYRVVSDGYQVIVLVPTTILCYQHYRSFSDRFEKFGFKVSQLNRFVSAKSQKETIADFEAGKVDIIVGTHRVLSKDVKPNNLGLVVIDEEQRFGVGHKERLKELKASCDLLTLSATPIPRTLHLSMLGLRDISIITTPPVDRLFVKTYIATFEEELVREAISRELARGGQVFFVHNRVEDIEEMAVFISQLLPTARVRTGHGRMPERSLEKVVVDFLEHKFDVLICTTIIESGIDMPNVNTLIVNRADRFGLAQLYQIRGRVGRSSRQAYAYFLTPPEERLSDDSSKRLEILATHQELGSGFQIASHDMELRGVGNLLGGEQTGKIADVGLDLYTEMLEATIREMKGEEEYKERRDIEIKIPVSAVIPQVYIDDENLRLQTYKSIFSAIDEGELRKLKASIADRFGQLPLQMERLFWVAELKVLLLECSVERFVRKPNGEYEVGFRGLSERNINGLIEIVMQKPKMYRLTPNYQLILSALSLSTMKEHDDPESRIVLSLLNRMEPLAMTFRESEPESP